MLLSGNSEVESKPDRFHQVLKGNPGEAAIQFCNHKRGINSLSSSRERLLARFVNQIVAVYFQLPSELLLKFARGKASATRARQVSIYLMHTTLSFSFTQIAKIYGKDRTTIAHACRLIEDLRDDPEFDNRLVEFELTISIVLNLSDAIVSDVVSDEQL